MVNANADGRNARQGSRAFTKRIGSTVYHVGVHFSQTSKQTANDKIIRLVKSDAAGKERNIRC